MITLQAQHGTIVPHQVLSSIPQMKMDMMKTLSIFVRLFFFILLYIFCDILNFYFKKLLLTLHFTLSLC